MKGKKLFYDLSISEEKKRKRFEFTRLCLAVQFLFFQVFDMQSSFDMVISAEKFVLNFDGKSKHIAIQGRGAQYRAQEVLKTQRQESFAVGSENNAKQN